MRALIAAFMVIGAMQAALAAPERVEFPSADGTRIVGLVFKPAGAGPFPALVLLHGCGGLFNQSGELTRRESDWADRLVAAGYAVVFPDSFNRRGDVAEGAALRCLRQGRGDRLVQWRLDRAALCRPSRRQ
jgi:dienelactone hydrolase